MAPPQLENEAALVSEKTPLTLNLGAKKELEKKKFVCRREIAAKSLAFLFVAMCLTGASMIVLGVYSKRGEPVTSSLSLSSLSPEFDLGLQGVDRADGANPSKIWGQVEGPYPTNSWYLNLVSHKAATKPDESTRVYTIPYMIDTAAADKMAGIRAHWPVTKADSKNIEMVYDVKNGLTLGTRDLDNAYTVDDAFEKSLLGLSLKWTDFNLSNKTAMSTHIVRGMSYATMLYHGGTLPSLHSFNAPADPLLIDGDTLFQDCGVIGEKRNPSALVQKEVQLHFRNSDFTWALFVSKPVEISCAISEGDINVAEFVLNVESYESSDDSNNDPLILRLALVDQCTTGKSDIKQHCLEKDDFKDKMGYLELLRESAHVFPSSPTIEFRYPGSESNPSVEDLKVKMLIDWKAHTTGTEVAENDRKDELVTFALPHQQADLGSRLTEHCITTLHGSTCLVKGAYWLLTEDVSSPVSFTAPRPPDADAIPELARAVSQDIHYRLSNNMRRAAADTYFSGKILARIGRVIVIASELKKLAEGSLQDVKPLYSDTDDMTLQASMQAAASVVLPSVQDIQDAIGRLKQGVEVWLSNGAEALYVFDRTWGGLVNCGCKYSGKDEYGRCKNRFPQCPALEDVNEDFGNGFYNDHHFHYGYHIYAAAVASKYDPSWGKKMFHKILLYVRDIANPLSGDKFFTQFRQKDWFLGSSWAAGIVSAENSPHGRNQESSSEAIAAYEGVALYGMVMTDVLGTENTVNLEIARQVRDAGKLLTLSEVRAANRYWHVWSSNDHVNTYPEAYTQLTVGMLYETQASFQTWFAPDAVVSYGIQLMPLTAIGEMRDDPTWAKRLYPLYKENCESSEEYCVDNGWSILQAGLLATTGERQLALKQALEIPSFVFDSEGGVGNSLSNTLWYIATRRPISKNKLET